MQTYAGESRKNGYDARHKKNGSKSKYCSLPSDGMTTAQWKRRNSKVNMHEIRRPIQWKLFKELDEESKNEYISYLADTFNVTSNELAAMFDCNAATIRRNINSLPVAEKFTRGRRMSQTQRALWDKFVAGETTSSEPEQQPEPQPAKTEEPKVEQTTKSPDTAIDPIRCMEKVTLSFDGPIDIAQIFNLLTKFVREDAVTKLEVSCTQTADRTERQIGIAVA